MKKNILLFAIGVCVVAFCSCQRLHKEKTLVASASKPMYSQSGSYLAGRVAHIRKDFSNAAKYYAKTVEFDDNSELISQLYIIYTSNGDLQNAAKYAKMLQDKGADNSFLSTIVAVDEVKEGDYSAVIKNLSNSDVPIYANFINPLILAWAHAGEGNLELAISSLSALEKEPSFVPLYYFQVALVYDFFNETKKADQYFQKISSTYKKDISFRAIQLMSNFYLRNGQKQKAISLISVYKNDELFSPMLNRLLQSIKSQSSMPKPIIDTPSKGLAESLFSIAATIRAEGHNVDLAHLFASMAIYSNPNYDLAKLLLADIFEERQLYTQANDLYLTIDQSSDAYDIIMMKKARNYSILKDYTKAQAVLEQLAASNPDSSEVYLNLGDALKRQDKYKEAIKAYNKAFDNIDKISPQHWVLYYSIGVAYDNDNQWHKAQEAFLKAIDLSNDHYLVQNYLGYIWMKKGVNTDNAFALIVDAYKQAPNDGNIADSLGYAFYRLGFYNKAIIYLEEAVLLEPNNPLILEHLADAYYMGGRQIEAGFQWQQSLLLKDNETKEYDPQAVEEKIKSGLVHQPLLIEDKNFVNDKIKELEEE